MCATFTDDELGKTVVNAAGEELGIVTAVEGGTAHVEPDPGLADTIKTTLGWSDAGDDTYPIEPDAVETIDANQVRLAGDSPPGSGPAAGTGAGREAAEMDDGGRMDRDEGTGYRDVGTGETGEIGGETRAGTDPNEPDAGSTAGPGAEDGRSSGPEEGAARPDDDLGRESRAGAADDQDRDPRAEAVEDAAEEPGGGTAVDPTEGTEEPEAEIGSDEDVGRRTGSMGSDEPERRSDAEMDVTEETRRTDTEVEPTDGTRRTDAEVEPTDDAERTDTEMDVEERRVDADEDDDVDRTVTEDRGREEDR